MFRGILVLRGPATLTLDRSSAASDVDKRQLEDLKNKNAQLQEEVEFSKTDAYLERMTRERLGYIKPGEVPVLNDDSLKSP